MAFDRSTIENSLRAALLPVPVDAISIEERQDQAGEDALFVTATLPTDTPLVGGKRYLAAMAAVSDALIAAGEQRFPYVHLTRNGEETAKESDPREISVR